jgi:sugar lactone lactonase YvrE
MRRLAFVLAAVLAVLGSTQSALATQPSTGVVRDYANLNGHCPNPEGIAIDPEGNVYASSAPHIFSGSGSANVCVISPSLHIREIPIAPGRAGVTNLLGELFEPEVGLYVVDFANGAAGNGRLLKVDPDSGKVTTLATGFQAANAIAQDRHRNLFVSDSFAGTITRVAPDGSSSTVWSSDPLLLAAAEYPFGANGLAFDRHQNFLYVANTSTRRILRIPVLRDGSAGPAQIFADGDTLNKRQGTTDALVRADGIMFDVKGNLYVCANASNEIQVLSPDGKAIIARYTGSGTNAMDFPASLVFKGRQLFISNLSLNDGGIHSKVSLVEVPHPGLPLFPDSNEGVED